MGTNITASFDQPVILEQSSNWSRSIAVTIIGITAFALTWACLFEIDESINLEGKLEPTGAVTDIKAPVNGVVETIHVQEGQEIKKGDILISLDQTDAREQLQALEKNINALKLENEFYRRHLTDNTPGVEYQNLSNVNTLNIPLMMTFLTQSRTKIVAENRVYRAQLQGLSKGVSLTQEQTLRLQNRQIELETRLQEVELEIQKTEQQISQNQSQVTSAKEMLAIDKKVLKDMEIVMKKGAFPRVRFLSQKQQVIKIQREIDKLLKDERRLNLVITQAREKLHNIKAVSQEEILVKITTNEKNIAEIDSQLSKIIFENQKKINDMQSQVSKTKTTLKYQNIIAPRDGIIFELKPNNSGFVVNSSEPILKIVPQDNLVAKVYISNKDIGFVKRQLSENQCLNVKIKENTKCPHVDIRIESFPFQRYGDIKGRLIEIGSDALPPTQIYPFWRYQAKLSLKEQQLSLNNGTLPLPLHSGMSINANLKLRKRSIISIFTDSLVQKAESIKFLRR
ncbi:MAG: HlyD family efflux transporter periplasmic adaptor subunit [Cyanobacteria bacterium P01_D01_bin.116]